MADDKPNGTPEDTFNKQLDALASGIDGMPLRDTPFLRDSKTGDIKRQPINWKERAEKAEKFFVQMVEERKKIQELIHEACLRLEKYGFKCDAGPLETCTDFRDIKAFAVGIPHVVRPPLEAFSYDGKRLIKRTQTVGDTDRIDVVLECGHIIDMSKAVADIPPKPKVGILWACELCTDMLKEKGLYEA